VSWPVAVVPLGGVACGTLLWRWRGRLHVTVVVKAAFTLVPDGSATLATDAAIATSDVPHPGVLGIRVASDLVPYRARADVTFVGHACSLPGKPVTSAAVRLAIVPGTADADPATRLDRTLHVYGDRDASDAVMPFARMPLVYERGAPACLRSGADCNVVDATDPRAAGGLGPLPARAAVPGAVLELGDDVDWSAFQSAPAEQRLAFLRGDEWIVLVGLHAALPRLCSRLPSVRALARAGRRSDPSAHRDVALVADTLAIDGDRAACAVGWRGSFALPGDESSLADLEIVAGVEIGGQPIAWPEAATLGTAPLSDEELRAARGPALPFQRPRAPAPVEPPPADDELPGTLALSDEQQAMLAQMRSGGAPFPLAAAEAPDEPLHLAPFPGAPWTGQTAPPPPPIDADALGTLDLSRLLPAASSEADPLATSLGDDLGAQFLAARPAR
jgi:hypothetical protein